MFELGTSERIQEVTKYENSFGIRRNWGIPSNGLSLLVSNAGSKVLIFTNANCEQRWCAIPTGGIQNCKTSDWNLNPKTLQECGNCSKSIKHMTFTFWPLRMNDRFSLRGNLECDLQDHHDSRVKTIPALWSAGWPGSIPIKVQVIRIGSGLGVFVWKEEVGASKFVPLRRMRTTRGNDHQLDEVVSNFHITVFAVGVDPDVSRPGNQNKVGRQKLVPSNFWIFFYYASYRICSKVVCCLVCNLLSDQREGSSEAAETQEHRKASRHPHVPWSGLDRSCSGVRSWWMLDSSTSSQALETGEKRHTGNVHS